MKNTEHIKSFRCGDGRYHVKTRPEQKVDALRPQPGQEGQSQEGKEETAELLSMIAETPCFFDAIK